MNKRLKLENELVNLNDGSKEINDKEKVEYFYRLMKEYKKKGVIKRFICQFLSGDGNELNINFFKIKSSSRLCFELYSWMANDDRIMDIEFEYKLPSLNTHHKIKGPNMDVYIETVNKLIFIESKFTELSYNYTKDIPKSYYKHSGTSTKGTPLTSALSYRYYNMERLSIMVKDFIEDIIDFIKLYKLEGKRDYFDVKQEITHLVGIIFYLFHSTNLNEKKEIEFYNIVYDFKEGKSFLAQTFIDKANILLTKIIKEYNINCKFKYDLLFIQDIIKRIPIGMNGFASNKTIGKILEKYKM